MKKKAIKYIRHYVITRASRLELEIWSLKLPILPIKLYSFFLNKNIHNTLYKIEQSFYIKWCLKLNNNVNNPIFEINYTLY